MTVPIERRAARAYCEPMGSLAIKLLALIAVLMLPLAMAAAPAEAHRAEAAAAMPMHHDGAHHSRKAAHAAQGECTMACSSALPAADLRPIATRTVPRMTPDPTAHSRLSGIELEIATPPPKAA